MITQERHLGSSRRVALAPGSEAARAHPHLARYWRADASVSKGVLQIPDSSRFAEGFGVMFIEAPSSNESNSVLVLPDGGGETISIPSSSIIRCDVVTDAQEPRRWKFTPVSGNLDQGTSATYFFHLQESAGEDVIATPQPDGYNGFDNVGEDGDVTSQFASVDSSGVIIQADLTAIQSDAWVQFAGWGFSVPASGFVVSAATIRVRWKVRNSVVATPGINDPRVAMVPYTFHDKQARWPFTSQLNGDPYQASDSNAHGTKTALVPAIEASVTPQDGIGDGTYDEIYSLRRESTTGDLLVTTRDIDDLSDIDEGGSGALKLNGQNGDEIDQELVQEDSLDFRWGVMLRFAFLGQDSAEPRIEVEVDRVSVALELEALA